MQYNTRQESKSSKKDKCKTDLENVNRILSNELDKIKHIVLTLLSCNYIELENFTDVIDLIAQKLSEAQVATVRQCMDDATKLNKRFDFKMQVMSAQYVIELSKRRRSTLRVLQKS